MSIPNYRVVLSYDADRKVFTAKAPELEHCLAEGATRGEAIGKLECEIEALARNMTELGQRPPNALDENPATGELAARISKTLHQELLWQAKIEGIELSQLVSELLGGALDGRKPVSRRSHAPRDPQMASDTAGNQRDYYERGDRGQKGYGQRYHGIMDDRANFIEYVRTLDNGNGPNRGPRRDDRGPGMRGPGPGPDDREARNHRRRRGGRGHGDGRDGRPRQDAAAPTPPRPANEPTKE